MKRLLLILGILLLSLPCNAKMFTSNEVCNVPESYWNNLPDDVDNRTPEQLYNVFLLNWKCSVANNASKANFQKSATTAYNLLEYFDSEFGHISDSYWSKTPFGSREGAINSIVINYTYSKLMYLVTTPHEIKEIVENKNISKKYEEVFQYSDEISYSGYTSLYANGLKTYLKYLKNTSYYSDKITRLMVFGFVEKVLSTKVVSVIDYEETVNAFFEYHSEAKDLESAKKVKTILATKLEKRCDNMDFGRENSSECYAAVNRLKK